jgi:hypothetical protein
VTTTGSLAISDTSVDNVLDITLQPPSKVFEHGGSSRENDVLAKGRQSISPVLLEHLLIHFQTHLIKSSSDIDRAGLNDSVNDLRKRGQEIRRIDLGIEENFRGKESFVSDIHIIPLINRQRLISPHVEIKYQCNIWLTLPVTLCSPVYLAKYL